MTDKTTSYTVSEGQFVADNDGVKGGGETVTFTAEQAASKEVADLLKRGLIK